MARGRPGSAARGVADRRVARGPRSPTDYWLSNLPADTEPERLARLARLRWKIELDYRQLKGELGLDHYEGRSWLGWHHHTALVTAAHGFLTLERLAPKSPAAGLTLPQAVLAASARSSSVGPAAARPAISPSTSTDSLSHLPRPDE